MQLTSPSLLSKALVTSCFGGAKLKPVAIGLISSVTFEPKTEKLVACTSAVHAGAERPEPCLRQSGSPPAKCGGSCSLYVQTPVDNPVKPSKVGTKVMMQVGQVLLQTTCREALRMHHCSAIASVVGGRTFGQRRSAASLVTRSTYLRFKCLFSTLPTASARLCTGCSTSARDCSHAQVCLILRVQSLNLYTL